MYYYRYFVISLLLLPTIVLAAVPSKELTLNNAILLALRYNPSLRNAEIQRIVDKFNLRLAENQYEVNYALTGRASYSNLVNNGRSFNASNASISPSAYINSTTYGTRFNLSLPNTINHNYGNGSYYSPGVSLTINQPLLRGFGKDVNMAPLYNAYDTEKINRLTLKNTLINTITQVISLYTNLIQSINTLRTQQLALKNSVADRERYKALISAGRNAPADLVQFEVNVANQQLSVQQQEINVQQARYLLLNYLGLDPTLLITVPKSVTLPEAKIPSLADSIDIALHNNISYQQILINLKILKRQVLSAKDQQNWQVDLSAASTFGGATTTNSIGTNVSQNRNNNVALELSIPINDLSRQQQLVQAKTSLQQAEINLSAAKQQIIVDVTNAYNQLLSQKQQIIEARKLADLASRNLQIAYTKLKFGKTTPFEVSSLQTQLINAQVSLINTEQNYINTVANFDQILGSTLQRWNIQLRDP